MADTSVQTKDVLIEPGGLRDSDERLSDRRFANGNGAGRVGKPRPPRMRRQLWCQGQSLALWQLPPTALSAWLREAAGATPAGAAGVTAGFDDLPALDPGMSHRSLHGNLPVGFYSDREIRSVWNAQFLKQRQQLVAALSTSIDYSAEARLWLESLAGLSPMDEAAEAKIRSLTCGLPPANGEYGSLWSTREPVSQRVLLSQPIPGSTMVIQQAATLQLSIIGCSFYDGAKVRFRCSQCPKEWTSMKGRIVFHLFRLEGPGPLLDPQAGQPLLHRGYNLVFKLFKQRCHEVSGHRDGEQTVFEEPQWYPEEIEKVMYNVFWRIGQTLYRVSTGEQHVQMWRRAGNPNQKHDKTSCQACQLGFCQSRVAKA